MAAKGMSSPDLENFIRKHGGAHMNHKFAGVYAADEVADSAKKNHNLRTVKHNLAYVVADTDQRNEPRTHWWTIINIHPLNTILFFDSFGLLGFGNFNVQDDVEILKGIFQRKEAKYKFHASQIQFDTIVCHVKEYTQMPNNLKNKLSPAAKGFLKLRTRRVL